MVLRYSATVAVGLDFFFNTTPHQFLAPSNGMVTGSGYQRSQSRDTGRTFDSADVVFVVRSVVFDAVVVVPGAFEAASLRRCVCRRQHTITITTTAIVDL